MMNSAVIREISDAERVRSELKVPATTAAICFVVTKANVSLVFS